MILLLDVGNSRIKWGVVEAARPRVRVAEGVLDHGAVAEIDELPTRFAAIDRMVGCNVAGIALGDDIDVRLRKRGIEPQWIRAEARRGGVRNRYDRPEQLGADRWAALIGARSLHAGACLVVCAGTATTMDILDADGDFCGGVILPGVDMMLRALAGNTARLPLAAGRFTPQPRCTADAIESGSLQAHAGAVERMFAQIAGAPDSCCLLTGGAAHRFADLLDVPLQRVDNLVLTGLAAIAADS